MKTVKYLGLIMIVLMLPSAAFAYGGGGGGMYWQYQTEDYHFISGWSPERTDTDLKMFGGFGYGVDRHGGIHGGFGYALVSDFEGEGAVYGGCG